MLDQLTEFLACPVCSEELVASGKALACPNRHSFDVARQGYVNFLLGSAKPGTADTPTMVQARGDFLTAGHFQALADAIVAAIEVARPPHEGLVVDVGAGTGYYLAAVLDVLPDSLGLALDISKDAVKQAARVHPRVGAAVADTWSRLPLRDSAADVILDIFAPRNFSEFSRVLTSEGTLVVATPTERHLAELVLELGLLTVDDRKDERLREAIRGVFESVAVQRVECVLELDRTAILALVGMGPSARHADELEVAVGRLPEPFSVTLAAKVTSYRRLPTSTGASG